MGRSVCLVLTLAALGILGVACEESVDVSGSLESAPILPNIVFIVGDDHGYPYFGFTGSDIVETPNLDRLAEEGVLFTQGFATSNVCRPSLWTLLTGLYPYQIHALAARKTGESVFYRGLAGRWAWRSLDSVYIDTIRDDPHTLPRELAKAGYVTFQGGKYWEGSYETAGFSEGMTRSRWKDVSFVRGMGLGRSTMRPVLDFIDRNRDRSFFVWYAPMMPHLPHDPPASILRRYENRQLSSSAELYYAMCTWFDSTIGELIRHLEVRGLRERTLIVFASDNGWQQEPQIENTSGSGGPQGKLSLSELAFRTPVIFNWPGRIPAGEVRHDLISLVDLYPTFLAYAGAEAPGSRLGRDLRPMLEGRGAGGRREVIGSTTFVRPTVNEKIVEIIPWAREASFTVTTADWHYFHNETRDEEKLYDRPPDHRDARDRIADHAEVARDFRGRIEKWKLKLIDSLDLEDESGPVRQ